MKLPVIPFLIAATLLGIAIYLFNTTGRGAPKILAAPKLTQIADVEGIETEVAISPDGTRCAVIADGDLWMLSLSDGHRERITRTSEPESFPAWSPDGKRLTFTRGADTMVVPSGAVAGSLAATLKADASSLSWSPSGRLVYVRGRGLWQTDVGGQNDKRIVAPDENPNVTLHSPRFSPDSMQIAFIKSLLDLSGQVWIVDSLTGVRHPIVIDRPGERPLDVGWMLEGRDLAFLTNRSGGYSVWHVNFADNTVGPLTEPFQTLLLAPIGMSIWNDRIVFPRHSFDSNIVLSDGKTVAKTDDLELEPAVSPDGKLVAYTIFKGNQSDIWTAGIDGSNPAFRTVGHEPRFTPDGFHVVYTHADMAGNDDVWRLDIRNGSTERVTDADELDLTPDASSDGRLIAFTSTRGVSPSVWIISASGGKRLRLNDGGYGPRFSPDGTAILYWNKGAFWTMESNGNNPQPASLDPAPAQAVGGWNKSMPLLIDGNEIRGPNHTVVFRSERPLWPRFDVLPDGRFLVAPIEVRETGLWALDLQFRTQ